MTYLCIVDYLINDIIAKIVDKDNQRKNKKQLKGQRITKRNMLLARDKDLFIIIYGCCKYNDYPRNAGGTEPGSTLQ